MADAPALSVTDVRIEIDRAGRPPLPVVDGVTFDLMRGEGLGIAGESGSGKSMLCRALTGTLGRHRARVASGSIRLDDRDITHASEHDWQAIRGSRIAFVPQSSLAGLNPVLTVRAHLEEALATRRSRASGVRTPQELLDMVRIARPGIVLGQRPHQLSGGMRQRTMIALALACDPEILVADEPTTALDVSVQNDILRLLTSLRSTLHMALILVSHDLGVLASVTDRIMVMYAGASVEVATPEALAVRARHPYSRGLRLSRIELGARGRALEPIPGEPVQPGRWPAGCRFAPRCYLAIDQCRIGTQPRLVPVAPDGATLSACLRATDVPGIA